MVLSLYKRQCHINSSRVGNDYRMTVMIMNIETASFLTLDELIWHCLFIRDNTILIGFFFDSSLATKGSIAELKIMEWDQNYGMIAEWLEWWWIQWYSDLRWLNDWRILQIYELRVMPWFKKSSILPSFWSFEHHS